MRLLYAELEKMIVLYGVLVEEPMSAVLVEDTTRKNDFNENQHYIIRKFYV